MAEGGGVVRGEGGDEASASEAGPTVAEGGGVRRGEGV